MNNVDINEKLAMLAGLENIEVTDDIVFASKPIQNKGANVYKILGNVDFVKDWNLLMELALAKGVINDQFQNLIIEKLMEININESK